MKLSSRHRVIKFYFDTSGLVEEPLDWGYYEWYALQGYPEIRRELDRVERLLGWALKWGGVEWFSQWSDSPMCPMLVRCWGGVVYNSVIGRCGAEHHGNDD